MILDCPDRVRRLPIAYPARAWWAAHQRMFCQVVGSARVEDEESYENHTYRL